MTKNIIAIIPIIPSKVNLAFIFRFPLTFFISINEKNAKTIAAISRKIIKNLNSNNICII